MNDVILCVSSTGDIYSRHKQSVDLRTRDWSIPTVGRVVVMSVYSDTRTSRHRYVLPRRRHPAKTVIIQFIVVGVVVVVIIIIV